MSDWPDSPLIRITSGSLWGGVPLHGALAASAGLSASGTSLKYQIIRGPGTGQLIRRDYPDSGNILAWEDVVPVPADDLKRLRDEFRGATISERLLGSLLQVTSHLAPEKLSPVGQAVSRVGEALSGSMTLPDTSSEEYLASLLDALSDFQGLENDSASLEAERTLFRIVRLCVEWIVDVASAEGQSGELDALRVLAEVQTRAESDPAIGGFTAMAVLAGDAAAGIYEDRETEEGRRRLANGLTEPVLTIAHYALALLAKSMEGGA
ncbi:hypothetical protein [Actinomyces oris]|uniref:hypothetical protein n=1 Tax=Actinomyces oris TaxID=544580 RepID=UPI00288BA96F|nr:hypothetical protein [Actinomyces oris]